MNTLKTLIIGTHNGIFHTDEVVGIALLSVLYNNNIIVRRTRDYSVLKECDIIVDIGGGQFDHHMPSGNGVRESGTPYASAGLVWLHFGKSILNKFECPCSIIEKCFDSIDKNIIEPVDKIDNGINANSIFDFVPLFLPNWNDDFSSVDDAFCNVLNIVVKIIETAIHKEIENVKANELVVNLLHNSTSNILELPAQNIAWQSSVISYNESACLPIDFVIFPYPAGGYAAQAVPPSIEEPFNQRVSFPNSWAGLTTTLPKVSGVKSASFCHNNLFFARAATKDDILLLCKLAINNY